MRYYRSLKECLMYTFNRCRNADNTEVDTAFEVPNPNREGANCVKINGYNYKAIGFCKSETSILSCTCLQLKRGGADGTVTPGIYRISCAEGHPIRKLILKYTGSRWGHSLSRSEAYKSQLGPAASPSKYTLLLKCMS